MTAPSPTTIRPSGSIRRTPWPITTAASRATSARTTTAPSPDFEQAITARPEECGAFYNRGIAYHEKRDYDRAIEDFNQAIKLNPKLARGLSARAATALAGNGDYEKAIARPDAGDQAQFRPGHALQRPRHRLWAQGRARPRHRRFRPGGRAQRAICADLQQPRHCLCRQEPARPRHPGLRPGGQAQRRLCRPPSTIAATPNTTRATTRRPSPTTTARSSSIRRIRSP